jgi:hypothetical protein
MRVISGRLYVAIHSQKLDVDLDYNQNGHGLLPTTGFAFSSLEDTTNLPTYLITNRFSCQTKDAINYDSSINLNQPPHRLNWIRVSCIEFEVLTTVDKEIFWDIKSDFHLLSLCFRDWFIHRPWKWKRYLPKQQMTFNVLRYVITQKIQPFVSCKSHVPLRSIWYPQAPPPHARTHARTHAHTILSQSS